MQKGSRRLPQRCMVSRTGQVGTLGGVTGGKSGAKKDREIPFLAPRVRVAGLARIYDFTIPE